MKDNPCEEQKNQNENDYAQIEKTKYRISTAMTSKTAQSTQSAVSAAQVSNSTSQNLFNQNTPNLIIETEQQSPDPKIDQRENDQDKVENKEAKKNEKSTPEKKQEFSKLNIKINECLEKFYEVMNDQAAELGLKKSNFASAHGMYVENNVSTAADIARLCHHIMKKEYFREIVRVSDHEVLSTVY